MRVFVAAFLMLALAACASRSVNVGTAAPPAGGGATFNVSNTLQQAVNVYVTTGGTDILAGQVPANSTRALTVSTVAKGATVALKAVTADGARTYTRDNVTLSSSFNWQVP
jgi:hypothetical protein